LAFYRPVLKKYFSLAQKISNTVASKNVLLPAGGIFAIISGDTGVIVDLLYFLLVIVTPFQKNK
jgi:hypothetical protein